MSAACLCMGCPHRANCRCRCSECNAPQVGFATFTPYRPTPAPFVDLDALAKKVVDEMERRKPKKRRAAK